MFLKIIHFKYTWKSIAKNIFTLILILIYKCIVDLMKYYSLKQIL